ncbi:MAG: TraB/GumN family protein [Pseudomonadales bacterium]|nr:TraB/GumN family protein [Pseudomonadales bacterium]
MRVFLFLVGLTAAISFAESNRPIEEVLVVAKQPGPKLWRITNGNNELWILGVMSPLPEDLVWDSSSVEAVLADAEEFIAQPGVGVSANPLKLLWVAPTLFGVQKIPDKKKLVDILPPDLYQRWTELKAIYIGRDKGIERHRPIIAADKLFKAALEDSGLTRSSAIHRAIDKLVKTHKIPKTRTSVVRRIKSPRAAVKKFKKSQIKDIDCFRKTIERIEVDLQVMQTRATAWAEGNLQALRALPYEDQNAACIQAVLSSSFADELADELDLVDVETLLEQNWLNAAANALETKTVSFATLPIEELLDPDGYVAGLATRGYGVNQ